MLDGIRLIKQGTDTWQTEQGFVKVKRLSNGILEARYPNGNIATFETSSSAPFSYVMTNCRDIKGSNIHYEYNQTNNLAYIQKYYMVRMKIIILILLYSGTEMLRVA